MFSWDVFRTAGSGIFRFKVGIWPHAPRAAVVASGLADHAGTRRLDYAVSTLLVEVIASATNPEARGCLLGTGGWGQCYTSGHNRITYLVTGPILARSLKKRGNTIGANRHLSVVNGCLFAAVGKTRSPSRQSRCRKLPFVRLSQTRRAGLGLVLTQARQRHGSACASPRLFLPRIHARADRIVNRIVLPGALAVVVTLRKRWSFRFARAPTADTNALRHYLEKSRG